ncbi:hypothetical protein L5515_018175 [Caenorhabditis briggsae]|uniref:Protein CBR-HEN-1 n=1 Tax=Caenorhabditis briggsae TaxID=6238 RepID=A0AAE9JR77_CAEBR|nr:hypothetical protein L5515_018175 [Caenorhabditis briggsae]
MSTPVWLCANSTMERKQTTLPECTRLSAATVYLENSYSGDKQGIHVIMNFRFIVFALCVSRAVAQSAFGHGSHRPLNDADEVAASRPICDTDRHGNKYMPCATPDLGNGRNWPCIKITDLCNGRRDCPNGDDEDHLHCFYHKYRLEEFQKLRKMLDEIRGKRYV